MSTIFVPNEFYCPITGELMKDPVTEPEGHTYEREAIMKWFEKSNTSPMTRKSLCEADLFSNIPLRKTIDSVREKLSEDQLKIDSQILKEELTKFNNVHDEISLKASVKNNHLFIRTEVPNMDIRQPVDIVLCIDVSGSMCADAPIKGGDGSSVSHGISVLSLTIAAAKTILNTLNEKDNISIITYSCKAKELFMDMPCTSENKKLVQQDLDDLKPGGTTNMWDGLKTSLDCLKLNSPPNKMKVIKLLTDGVPSHIPNRGHEYELEKYFKKENFKCMINCYGFGYSLNSELLDNISRISGGDGYAFIPDSSLLGNVFIHGVSNFFTTAIYNIPVKINYVDGTSEEIKINSLKYGQDRNIVMEVKKDVSDVEMDINGTIIKSDLYDILDDYYYDYYYEQLYRYKTYLVLDNCMKLKKFNDNNFKSILNNLLLEISLNDEMNNNNYIKNIVFDLGGQVKEALNMTSHGEKEDWFSRWGIHYLRSLKTAYENEICNNFKDKGVSNFTGPLFETLRDEVSDIFDSMPAPKKTIMENTYQGYSGLSNRFDSSQLPSLPTMQSYNVQGGGCCAKGSRIRMEDNSWKKVEDLVKGDEVITVDIKNGVQYIETGFIECVIVTKCDNNVADMVSLTGIGDHILNITPYHPIVGLGLTSSWTFPIDVKQSKLIMCEEMYTFVISNRQSVLAEDFVFATYGHNLQEEVIKHAYLGTDKVIEDLKQNTNYKKGNIYLTQNMFKRDNTGAICGIGLYLKYKSVMNKIYMTSNL